MAQEEKAVSGLLNNEAVGSDSMSPDGVSPDGNSPSDSCVITRVIMAQEEVSVSGLLNNQAVGSDGISPDGVSLDGISPDCINSLSLWNKLCYAIGGAPYQISGSALGFFLQIFLLDVAELSPFYVSIIVFSGRAWDAITDPVVGFLVSRSPWMWFGRHMTWIVLSTPFAVLAYFLVWYVPPFGDGNLYFYLVFYCLFVTLQTCFHVPYTALTMFITSDQNERDSCSAYRMTVEVLGVLIGTAIQGQIVGMASAPCIPVSSDVIEELDNSTSMFAVNTTAPPISLEDTRFFYMMASCAIGGIYIFCAIVLYFGVKERKESSRAGSEPISFCQAMRMVVGYRPYLILNIACLSTATGFYVLEGNFAVFCIYTLGLKDQFQNVLLASMISASLSVPFWHWLSTKFGKKTTFYVGTLLAVPFLILIVLVKSNVIFIYFCSIGTGVSIGAGFLMPWTMLPDVIDDYKVHNPDSLGHEAIFYSFYVFSSKFSSGLSLGISTLSLYFTGYITRGCSQPDDVNFTLRLLISALPVLFIVVGLVIFYYYPVNEETRKGNSKLLQELQDNKRKWTQEIQNDSTEQSNMVSKPVDPGDGPNQFGAWF